MKKKANIVFFLGAGFTKAMWSHAPITKELTDRVLSQVKELGGTHARVLRNVIARIFPHLRHSEGYADVEQCLRLLFDLRERGRRSDARRILGTADPLHLWNLFVVALGRILNQTSFQPYSQPPVCDLVNMLKLCLREAKTVSVMTTNYDLIADKAVQIVNDHLRKPGRKKRWTPDTSDVRRYKYGFSVRNLWTYKGGRPVHLNKSSHIDEQRIGISIFKLHGSLNWSYCENCGEIDLAFKGRDLRAVYRLKPARCPVCNDNYQWLIIPPVPGKELQGRKKLEEMLRKAEQTLNRATHVIFIGYSLPPVDPHLLQLLIRSRCKPSSRGRPWRYAIFNPDWSIHGRFVASFGEGLHYGQFSPEQFCTHDLKEILLSN